MADGAVDLDALRAQIAKKGGDVRQLKKDGAPKEDIMKEVAALKELRAQLEALAVDGGAEKWKIDIAALEDLLKRRMFICPAFEIYRGVAGLYDFGPPGCGLKDNLLNLWKQHFVLQENMLQVECTTLTPELVLATSGHVEKFTDLMAKDPKTGECFRADKLLEDHIEQLMADVTLPSARREELRKIAAQADAYSPEELHALIQELGIKSPSTGNDLTEPFPFNLMFQTAIGPSGQLQGYLRPETAQGIFVNFRRLLDYNNGKMPFAAAQIGLAFRNEISPRNGLLRVREFTMAEIEHFVKQDEKDHIFFEDVKDVRLVLFPRENQVGDGKTIEMTTGDAVAKGIIDNQTLAYYVARTQLFLLSVGIRAEGLRFRQHLSTEMAHYACDCWDAEILMSSGWVECVGHADRACYDLKVHSKKSKVELVAAHKFAEPQEMEVAAPTMNKGLMGRQFKKENSVVQEALAELLQDVDAAMEVEAKLAADGSYDLEAGGKVFTLTRDMLEIERTTKKVGEIKYYPSVIEPSFGIGRIITAIFEHNFYVREGAEKRGVLAFNPLIAPVKVSVFPLDGRIDRGVVRSLASKLRTQGIANMTDETGTSIGKRYARTDEIGIPFAITIDHQVSEDDTVTLRERDSMGQVRLPQAQVVQVLEDLVATRITWADVTAKYPVLGAGDGSAE